MELRQLHYFVTVAEELHFGHAAERLHMAQSPLSRHIRALERELRTPLLTRTTRRVELTPAGQALLERGRAILRTVEDATRLVGRLGGGIPWPVRLAFTGCSLNEMVGRVLRLVRNVAGDVQVDVQSDLLTPRQLDAIAHNHIDVGFLVRPPGPVPTGLCVHTLRTRPLTAVLPRGHRLTARPVVELAELADEDFISFSAAAGGSVVRRISEHACETAGFQPRIMLEAQQTNAMLGLVAAGLGCALLPLPAGDATPPGVVVRRLSADFPVDVAMAWRRGEDREVVRRIVAEICREHECLVDPRCCGTHPCSAAQMDRFASGANHGHPRAYQSRRQSSKLTGSRPSTG